jgi:preprotein translocase subunit SecA
MSVDLSTFPREHRRRFAALLAATLERIEELRPLRSEDLPAAAAELRRLLAVPGATSDPAWVVEPFALAATAARLTLNLDPFEVQVLAALVLAKGALAEVRTGEGKTLIATLPTVAFALAGRQVHVMTANPYLAARDAEWMRPLYEALSLTVASVDAHPSLWRRQTAYRCDIVYGTASQFGFDYLNDHLIKESSRRCQLRREVAIVDEADALLLDDARTPLIIAGAPRGSDDVQACAAFVTTLPDSAVDVDLSFKVAMLNDEGFDLAESFFDRTDLTSDVRLLADIYAALRARFCFERDKDYLVQEGLVVIVDESTGRLQPDRRWQNGLHEAIEAKEGVVVHQPSPTLGSITVPSYLANYEVVSAMTGTAMSDKEEFNDVYGLHVFSVPTHRTTLRIDADDLLFVSTAAKFTTLAADVAARHAQGQPVLIGAPTVADAERISALLESLNLHHDLLSARDLAREAAIIAQAGRSGAITVATNLAGRGVDILLGGDVQRFAAANGLDSADLSEAFQADRARVLAAGGLAVLGTARHTSRRIDDQLRGRAGRQGEPGFTQFYLSLEDDLLSVYSSDTARAVVSRAAASNDDPISHKMVTKLVASAQAKVENLQRDARRSTNEFASAHIAQQTTLYAWRDSLVDEDPRAAILSILRPALRTFFANLSAGEGLPLTDIDDTVLLRGLSFGLELIPHWADLDADAVLPDLRALPDPDAIDRLAVRMLDEFLSRNDGVASDLEPMLRMVALAKLDEGWYEHLELLDAARDASRLRSSGQLKPQTEYVFESARLFQGFTEGFFSEVGQLVALGVLSASPPPAPAAV